MAEISVIVPIFNTEKLLPRCVGSILAQSFRDFELILVDDGSRDGSGIICDAYAKRDSRIRVIHQQNIIGVAINREEDGHSIDGNVSYITKIGAIHG